MASISDVKKLPAQNSVQIQLPVLKHLAINALSPLSYETQRGFPIKNGVNLFIRPNGQGKTTLADSIECSFFADAEPSNSLIPKAMNDKSFLALQFEINGKLYNEWKIYLRNSLKIYKLKEKDAESATNRQQYVDTLEGLTGLKFSFLRAWFNFCVYMREIHLFFPLYKQDDFQHFINELNSSIYPQLIGLKDLTQKIDRLKQDRAENSKTSKTLQKQLKLNIEQKDQFEQLLNELSSQDKDQNQLIRELNSLEEKRRVVIDASMALNQEHDGVNSQIIDKTNILSQRERQLQKKAEMIQDIDNQLKNLSTPTKVDSSPGNKLLSKYDHCNLCGSHLEESWNQRVSSSFCPVCAHPLDQNSSLYHKLTDKKSDFLQEDREKIKQAQESLLKDKETITVQMGDLKRDISTFEIEIGKLREQKEDKRSKIHTLRSNLLELDNQIKVKQRSNEKIAQFVQLELLRKDTPPQEITNLNDRIKNIDEKSAQLEKEIESQQSEIKQRLSHVQELFLKTFRTLSVELFSFPLTLDIEQWIITYVDNGETISRSIPSLSSSERYFVDLLFRITIQELFIHYGMLARGFLLLDSPETAIDGDRLKSMAVLLTKISERFNIIICTTTESLKELFVDHKELVFDYPKSNLLRFFRKA